jgi:hypothetical protein
MLYRNGLSIVSAGDGCSKCVSLKNHILGQLTILHRKNMPKCKLSDLLTA